MRLRRIYIRRAGWWWEELCLVSPLEFALAVNSKKVPQFGVWARIASNVIAIYPKRKSSEEIGREYE